MSMTVAESAQVIGDLRRARRRQRVAAIHWVDALYQVYITALVAVVGVVFVSGLIGDGEVSAETVADVVADGPAALGVVAALAVLVGLRSGSRGGPLALERADVRHVLLAPIDRGVALRGPAWRQLRFMAAVGAALGAAAGLLASQRLPETTAEWLLAGAAFGVTVAGLGFGSALVAGGVGIPTWLSTALGLGLVGWAVADVIDRIPASPTAFVGEIAIAPLDFDIFSVAGPLVALVLVGVGMLSVAGTSLEAAERRTSLVGQMRFAVTLQDLRTVMVLRRQLAQERPRSRPWVRGSSRPARNPIVRRAVRSIARWPVGRLVRVAGLAAIAGLAMRGTWGGTTPLIVVAGLALWVAALDAVEPMGQEIDHPGRTDMYPLARGELLVGLLPVVLGVSALVGVVAGGVAALPLGDALPVAPALLVGFMAGLLAGCGAVVSTVQGAPDAVDLLAVATPEIAGMKTVMRTAWPPVLAVAGVAPLLLARSAERSIDGDPLGGAFLGSLPVIAVVGLVGGWVRFHDEIHEWFRNAIEQASPTKAMERAAAEREAAEAGLDPDQTASPA
ncbi:MAG: hypothetical protein GX643_08905, partial [Acidimicrobiales bacterium]|nr:hypothetical protein [Acidimicrobiales bacterium]